MIKPILIFIFGNALWDKLIEIFGSTEAVVEVTIAAVCVFLLIKYFKVILGIVAVIIILLVIYS